MLKKKSENFFQQNIINLFEILDSISSDLKWHSHIKNNATILGSVQRAKADVQSVEAMLDSLNIQAVPSQVYRIGPFSVNNNQKRPRLVKVVLPSSRIQNMTLGALKNRRQELKKVDGFY